MADPARLRGLRALVVGEAMLDRTLWGRARRLCPDGPAPVLSDLVRTEQPGGAANTALNLAALGARVRLASLVGADEAGDALRSALEAGRVDADAVLVPIGRRTLTKTRVVADGRLLARFDEGCTAAPEPAESLGLARRIAASARSSDVVTVSDYAYGVLGPEIRAALRGPASRGTPLVVDARDLTLYAALRPLAVVPNHVEACALLGIAPEASGRAAQIAAQASGLLRLTGARMVVVTLDAEGAILLRNGRAPVHVPSSAPAVVDACGAGDTFAAALSLSLAAGDAPEDAVAAASLAAAVVVGKRGTATCSAAELARAAAGGDRPRAPAAAPRILSSAAQARRLADACRRSGRRVVFTNGCFDVVHRGHADYLRAARQLGDVLIVGVNDDASVRRLKGPGRPVNACADRLELVASLGCVDHVLAFAEATPAALIEAVRPDVFVKGGDYTRSALPEAALVERLGGRVVLLDYLEGYSTTGVIARIRGAAVEAAE